MQAAINAILSPKQIYNNFSGFFNVLLVLEHVILGTFLTKLGNIFV
jgi:hypothetical protein